MVISTTLLQADLDFAIADLPCTLVWGSQTITATRSEVRHADDVQDDGIFVNSDLELVASVDDFSGSTLPGTRVAVTVDSVGYWIEEKVVSQDGLAVTLRLRRI